MLRRILAGLALAYLLAVTGIVAHTQPAPITRYKLMWTWADPAASWSAGFRHELVKDPEGQWVWFEDLPASCR